MALVGYFIVFSFVTKPGQTLEFLLWGTIVPLNFLAGYHCSIVASRPTPQPMAYAFTPTHRHIPHLATASMVIPCTVFKKLSTFVMGNNTHTPARPRFFFCKRGLPSPNISANHMARILSTSYVHVRVHTRTVNVCAMLMISYVILKYAPYDWLKCNPRLQKKKSRPGPR